VWGRVAAVQRTLYWLEQQPTRMAGAEWVGASCQRLLAQAASESEGELAQQLMAALAGLTALAEGSPEERAHRIPELRAMLTALLPLSQVGARALLGEPSARLLPARRSRKGRDKERRKNAKTAKAEQVPAAEPEVGAAEQGGEEPGSSPAVDELDLPLVVPARRPKPEPALPPPPPRYHLAHPERGGRPLAGLDSATEDLLAALAAEGILTVGGLLDLPPCGHDREALLPIGQAHDDEGPVTTRGRLRTRCTLLTPDGGRRWEVVLEAKDGQTITCRWLTAAPRGFHEWRVDSELALIGQPELDDDGPFLYEGEPVGLDGRGSGWMPRYEVGGISSVELRALVASAITELQGTLKDLLPSSVLDRHRLLPLDEALRDAHFPSNNTGRGRVRMAFQELLLLQLGIAQRAGRGQNGRGLTHKARHDAVGKVGILHNLQLDDGQEIAFSEIRRDLQSSSPMARLLQGDVGGGKGLIALMSTIVVAENRAQVAVVAPDALAAERRFLFAENILRSVGLSPMLLGDRIDHAQADALRRGEAHVVYGTRSLLDQKLEWRRLGLVVVEERGPFGTVSPASLQRKAATPDLLVVTRAPIPSSLAFTVFGEFDVSVVPVLDPPRVSAKVFTADERSNAYARARELVEAGEQAYIVFPVKDGRDLLSLDDALAMARALNADAFPSARIGVYCSTMSREDRSKVFDDFQRRRIDVLVCTTHIEDAPTVANATVLVVEYADMHELTRLHLLRGHVGYGHRQGSCSFVLSDRPAGEATAMLRKVVEERDGFRLAEHDLKLRGAAALLGDRAEEAPAFNWADPPRDRELLLRARAEAFRILERDPRLRRAKPLANAVHARWGDWLGEPPPAPPGAPSQGEGRGGRRRRRRRRRS